jgi:hypothetical protein
LRDQLARDRVRCAFLARFVGHGHATLPGQPPSYVIMRRVAAAHTCRDIGPTLRGKACTSK